jgi:hypothetical protein
MAKTKKRKASKAQLAALARGRKKLKAKRRTSIVRKPKRKTTKRKTGGVTMAKRKRRTTSRRATAKRYVSRVRNFARKSKATEMLTDAAFAIAGGVTSGFITSKIPIADARVRSFLPIVAGIVVAGTLGQKNNIAMKVAQGMVILGAVSAFKQFAPGVPMLAGERVIMLPVSNDRNMGIPVQLGANRRNERMGIPVRLGGSYRDYKTSANM